MFEEIFISGAFT